jgi:hypothetical protein
VSLPEPGSSRHEHQHVDRKAIGHQRRGESTVGLADDDQVAAVADGLDHGVGILR